MELKYCKIEPSDKGSWFNLGIFIPQPLTPSLVMDIGKRIERFISEPDSLAPASDKPEAEVSPAAEPVSTRRTRAVAPPAAEPAPPAAEPASARRTRAPKPEAAPVINDMDLAKAASDAAEIVTPATVKEIIAEMGVSTVNQIEGYERRKYFLDLLSAEIAIVKDGETNANA